MGEDFNRRLAEGLSRKDFWSRYQEWWEDKVFLWKHSHSQKKYPDGYYSHYGVEPDEARRYRLGSMAEYYTELKDDVWRVNTTVRPRRKIRTFEWLRKRFPDVPVPRL